MKRVFITAAAIAAATAAFALPTSAPAQDLGDVHVAVACPEGVTECVRDWVNWAIDTANNLGPIIGDACEVVFPDCALLTE